MLKVTIWSTLLFISFIVIDQTLTHIHLDIPVVRQGQNFYIDFRTRLLTITGDKSPESIESVIEISTEGIGTKFKRAIDTLKESVDTNEGIAKEKQERPKESQKNKNNIKLTKAEIPPKKIRYIYADEFNNLQFTDSLDDVPLKFRKDAQPLKE